MNYREVHPCPTLRPFVRGYWSLSSGGASCAGEVQRILPDGCAEIVLNRAHAYRRLHEGGTLREQAEALVVGQLRRAITIVATGQVDLVGIRLEPAGLHALLGAPMHELTEQDAALEDLDRGLSDDLARATRGPGSLTPPGSLSTLERALCERLETRARRGAGLAAAAVRLVEQGVSTTGDLARALDLNRRALERLFRNEVGLAPKSYVRVRRLQSVLRRLDSGFPPRSWADVARAHGYADQSHLIRDFRLLARTTPLRYLAERSPLAACFELGELSHPHNPRAAGRD